MDEFEALQEDVLHDIYSEQVLDEQIDDDLISSQEEGFMRGYLAG